MKILVYLCVSILEIVNNTENPNVRNLLQRWNKISLSALEKNVILAVAEEERTLYQNRVEVMPGAWEGIDSINYKSIRLLFLEQISADFNWKDKRWAVIEVVKNGEIKRLINYLIYYNGSHVKIVAYRYYIDKWERIQEWQQNLKLVSLFNEKDKVPMNKGSNSNDVIVTNFKSEFPIQSAYYIESTLARGSQINDIILR